MAYIDGCVIAVPTANREKYLAHARIAAQVFRDLGAIEVTEYWGEDVPEGEVTSFPKAVKAKADETVVFSWIKWPSKAVRDAAMPKMMEDERLNPEKNPMPFDGKRMIFGGFEEMLTS